MTKIRTAPRPMAPYVMRLELSPPMVPELEDSVLVSDDDAEAVVEEPSDVPAVEGVEEAEDDDVVEVAAELVDVVVLHESAVALGKHWRVCEIREQWNRLQLEDLKARTAVVADACEGAGVGRVVLLPARVGAVQRVDAGRALARGGVARGAAILEAGRDGAAEVARVGRLRDGRRHC